MVQFDDDEEEAVEVEERSCFCINDNMDVLVEILKRLDHRSLAVAASVCRLWCALTRNDALWEHLCFRHVSPPPHGVRTVVLALGGYRSLYMLCVKPLLSRPAPPPISVELSLSLFCVDYYERVFLTGGTLAADSPSLMFLCKAVNV